MNYQLSAQEILSFLGYQEPVGAQAVEQFKREKGISLPQVYESFLRCVQDCPLLETADVWSNTGNLRFFYEDLDERIEEDSSYWEQEPEKYQEDEYYQFSKIPREKWGEKVGDFLLIGSDFGVGIVEFGIRVEDLDQPDPPVFYQHEADSFTVWKQHWESVSAFLLDVLAHALISVDYCTAIDALEDDGRFDIYEYGEEEYERGEEPPTEDALLAKYGIDLTQVQRIPANWGGSLYCCMNQDTLFVGTISTPEFCFYAIRRR